MSAAAATVATPYREHIEKVLAAAPPLTPTLRDRIIVLLTEAAAL
jgi:hypothetical protein